MEERYGDANGYLAALHKAADELIVERLLLPRDAPRY